MANFHTTWMWRSTHATCQGGCTWFDFAAEVFRIRGLSPDLSPQTTEESGARATRPSCSVLENAALKATGIDAMPAWQEALEDYLQRSQG